jgi:hypothetical protein
MWAKIPPQKAEVNQADLESYLRLSAVSSVT